MKKQVFSDEQKNKLAGLKVSYAANRELAKSLRNCSLQAAEILWDIADIFHKAAQAAESERELNELVRRFKDVAGGTIVLTALSFAEQKDMLVSHFAALRTKTRSEVKRLRKAL